MAVTNRAVGARDLALDLQPGVTVSKPAKSFARQAVAEIQKEALAALDVDLAAARHDRKIARGLKSPRHQMETRVAIVDVFHKLELAVLRRRFPRSPTGASTNCF